VSVDLLQLRCLAALHRLGRVQRAAEALGMRTEDVQEALDRLQAALGVRLVTRHNRFTGLTPAGHRFAAVAAVASELVSAGATHIGASAATQRELAVPCVRPEPQAQRVSRRRPRAGAIACRLQAPANGFSQAAE
jgi:DNA-binding transcriptional LysR family regulator